MGILTQLTTQGSNYSEFDGQTPPPANIDVVGSTLHNQYSLNGNPNMPGFPSPSQLDLNGQTPPKYMDNLPL
jgi:hypothetical protein